MNSGPLQALKTIALKAVNAFPVSSTFLGSPRRIRKAAQLNKKESSCEYRVMRKAEKIVERPPVTIDDEVFFKYEGFYQRTVPEQFILKLTNGRVWGRNGAIITEDDIFVSDLSQEFGPAKSDVSKHSIWRRLKLKKPVEIRGDVAVIASPGGNVYAHWLCDIMPRLVSLKNEGILEKVEKIVMSFDWIDWQVETLDRLGIDKNKIINCIGDTEFHLRATTLYVPSYPNEHGTVNQHVCESIRNIYIDKHEESQRNERLYISRAKAKGRQLINEEEVVGFLEKEYGFRKIFAEDFATAKTAKLFYNAECVIGPHGGGFTNLMFCSPGCKVVDVFPPGDFTTYFWVLANANQLEYAYLFGRGEMPASGRDFALRNENIDLDLDRLKLMLEKLNLSKQ